VLCMLEARCTALRIHGVNFRIFRMASLRGISSEQGPTALAVCLERASRAILRKGLK
jgi:hypothetical protein